jgi:hypothetical protein
MSNELEKMAKNVRDTVKEGIHNGEADAEHERRTEMGDVMTGGEKAESVAHEVSEKAKAGVDRLKRDARDL